CPRSDASGANRRSRGRRTFVTSPRSRVSSCMSSKGKPYRRVVVDAFEILIGKGDRENDVLTFDVAEPRDLWMHVAGGVSGSHVFGSVISHTGIWRISPS